MALRCLLTGSDGGVSKELLPLLRCVYDVIPVTRKDLDLSDPDSINCYFLDQDPFDILVHTAVVSEDGYLTDVDPKESIQVNCIGTSYLYSNVCKGMKVRGWGRIVGLSSIVIDRLVPRAGYYAACKSFGETLLRQYALEYAKFGICTGSVRMGYWDAGLTSRLPPSFQEQKKQSIPLRRFGSPTDLFSAIHYFVNNPYATGSVISLIGGPQ